MTRFFTLFILLIAFTANAQTVADFENFNIKQDTFIKDAGVSRFFTAGNVSLPNNFIVSKDVKYYNGWFISSMQDTITGDYTNQYSSISGDGYNDSQNYAVVNGNRKIYLVNGDDNVKGMYINNTTYAAKVIKEGNTFSKAFGGETGNDKDYFSVTFKGYEKGEMKSDSVTFYLADYRFDDNKKDYIVKEWTYVDLQPLGKVDSLSFYFASSDVGKWGINTPLYFAVDNIKTSLLSSANDVEVLEASVYPNPTTDFIEINGEEQSYNVDIYTLFGQKVLSQNNTSKVDVRTLPKGIYVARIFSENKETSIKIIKE